MKEPYYPFQPDDDSLTFTFTSVSASKTIEKVVSFGLIDENANLYNLALVDSLSTGELSDQVVSNNQDMPKVLATVYQIVTDFLNHEPSAKLLIRGSTPSRTRLYQMAIAKYWDEFEQNFQILGLKDVNLESFERGVQYDGFIVFQRITD